MLFLLSQFHRGIEYPQVPASLLLLACRNQTVTSHYVNTFVQESMVFHQYCKMLSMLDLNLLNRPQNMDIAQVVSPIFEYLDANYDNDIKVDDEETCIGHAKIKTFSPECD